MNSNSKGSENDELPRGTADALGLMVSDPKIRMTENSARGARKRAGRAVSPFGVVLSRILDERKARNPKYSLRALARELKLSHTTVWAVVQGKATLSLKKTKEAAVRAKLFDQDLDELLTRTRLHLEPQDSIRKVLEERCQARTEVAPAIALAPPAALEFRLLAALIVLECLELERTRGTDLNSLVSLCGISPKEVSAAVAALSELGLVQSKDGRLFRKDGRYSFSSKQHHPRLKQAHADALRLAKQALSKYMPGERYSGTEVLPIARSRLAEAMELSHRYLEDLQKLTESSESPDGVYIASVQLFPVARKS